MDPKLSLYHSNKQDNEGKKLLAKLNKGKKGVGEKSNGDLLIILNDVNEADRSIRMKWCLPILLPSAAWVDASRARNRHG